MFHMGTNAKIIAEPSFGINTSERKVFCFFFLTILLFVNLAALGQSRHTGSSLNRAGYVIAIFRCGIWTL